MTTKSKALELLDEYFEQKGRVLNMGEYKTARDAPIRYQIVQQLFGSWNKVERMMLARRVAVEPVQTNVADVIAEIAAQETAELEAAKAAKAKFAEEAAEETAPEEVKPVESKTEAPKAAVSVAKPATAAK